MSPHPNPLPKERGLADTPPPRFAGATPCWVEAYGEAQFASTSGWGIEKNNKASQKVAKTREKTLIGLIKAHKWSNNFKCMGLFFSK